MIKNLFAFVTFGNLPFTQLTVKSIRETVHNPYDIFAVVGKPGDTYTKEWLDSEGIANVVHTENMGFPVSVNDIYDYAWVYNNYDNLILCGNDIVLYPYAGDSLINFANVSTYKVISALQYDVKDLLNEHPDAEKYFTGSNYIIDDFTDEPWRKFTDYSEELSIADMQLYDIQNLCLYKRDAFDKVGYTDVNFFPAYYIDNDYAMRLVASNIKCCTLTNARFFHFWSRTIHQGSGGSTPKYFEANRRYYKMKWGGDVGHERKIPDIRITTRDHELITVRRWRNK